MRDCLLLITCNHCNLRTLNIKVTLKCIPYINIYHSFQFSAGAVLTESSVVNVTEPGFDLYIYVFDGKNLVGPKVLTVQMKGNVLVICTDLNHDISWFEIRLSKLSLKSCNVHGTCMMIIEHDYSK